MIPVVENGKETLEQITTGGWGFTSEIGQFILQNAGRISAASL